MARRRAIPYTGDWRNRITRSVIDAAGTCWRCHEQAVWCCCDWPSDSLMARLRTMLERDVSVTGTYAVTLIVAEIERRLDGWHGNGETTALLEEAKKVIAGLDFSSP